MDDTTLAAPPAPAIDYLDDAVLDAALLAVIAPTREDRERYAAPEDRLAAIRALFGAFADERAAWRIEQVYREERWPASPDRTGAA